MCFISVPVLFNIFRWDVYIYSPCGMKFASKKKLSKFLEMTNQSLDPEDFDFTPYGQQDPEPLYKLPDHGTSANFGRRDRKEDQYVFPRIQNTAPACAHGSDLLVHRGTQDHANLQPVDPVIMIENNPHSIILEIPQPQVLNLSLNQTMPQPLLICDSENHQNREGNRDKARAKKLATAINAATRDDLGERLASTSSLLTSSTIVTSEQQEQTFDTFTYKATTSSYLPNFDLI